MISKSIDQCRNQVEKNALPKHIAKRMDLFATVRGDIKKETLSEFKPPLNDHRSKSYDTATQIAGAKGEHVAKRKRKLTKAEKRARRERKEKYMTIFINGKQKRVPRPPTIDGLTVDEFIRRNADPIWLHQNEMWELMPPSNED